MSKTNDEMERLIRDYLDGVLPESQRGALLHRLRNDPESRDLLAQHALMDARLRKLLRDARPAESVGVGAPRRRNRWLAAAAAAVLAAGAIPFFGFFQSSEAPVFADFRVSPFSNFTLEGPGSESGQLGVGGQLVLSQGAVDLTLPTGVNCLVSAPTKLTLTGPNEIEIDGGLAHFDVPESGKGFIVRTSDFEVIDHGTEFTIDSTEKGRNEAHVVRGRIEVRALGESGETSMLTEGQAVRRAAQGLSPMAANVGRFPARLPDGLPALWFSFDGEDPQNLPVAGSLAETARVKMMPPALDFLPPELIDGRFGKALRFPGNEHSIQTSWPGIEGTMARSISLWFRSEPEKEARRIYMPLVAWGLPSGPKQMSSYGIELGGASGQLRLRITSGRRWLQGGTVLDDGKWHHLVVVLEAHRPGEWPIIRVVIDGRSESMMEMLPEDFNAAPLESFYTVVNDPRAVPLTFGRFTRWQDYESQAWEIDEVCIAAGILLPQQIEALRQGRIDESGLALGKKSKAPAK